jgi:hypothetical protein
MVQAMDHEAVEGDVDQEAFEGAIDGRTDSKFAKVKIKIKKRTQTLYWAGSSIPQKNKPKIVSESISKI